MNRLTAYLGVLAALGMIGWMAGGVTAQGPAPAAGQRIALVNIAKVLRNFDKANAQGKIIQDKRKTYIDMVNAKRASMADKQKQAAAATDPAQREAIQKEMLAINRQIEDLDRDAQKELGEMSNNTIVQVYMDVQGVIQRVAAANGISIVFCYPDATLPTDANSPAVAQLKLQTPAAMPFFFDKNIDATDVVIQTLNASFPVPKPTTQGIPAPNGTPGVNVPMQ